MRLGQTNFRVAGLLASGRRRRKLSSNVKVSEQVLAGETTYVVKIPETGAFVRYAEFQWEVLTLFDGKRTDREVWEELRRLHPEAELTLEELEDFADSSDPNLWEKTLTDKNLALLEKMRAERQERAAEKSVFYLYFSAWDPKGFLDWIHPYIRWMWSRWALYVSLVIIGFGLVLFIADLSRITADALRFYNFREKNWTEFVHFWFLLLFIGFIHECAHGLTCKNYGGEVRQMGFLLMYLTPAFYTDVTDIYLFDKDYKRFWTIFAGIWIETVMCALALIAWSFSAPGTAFNDWAYKLMLFTSITGLALNLNPLMKFDGYYALCQALKLDNLREDSFAYAKQWLEHLSTLGRAPVERVSRRKHRIYLIYAPLAFLYSMAILLFMLGWVKNITTSKMGVYGWLVTGLLAYVVLGKRLAGLGRGLVDALKSAKEAVMPWRQSWQTQVVTAAVLLLLLVPPFALKVTTDFTLEPAALAEIRAATPGLIEEVLVREGQAVERGAGLARLHNPNVKAQAAIVERELQLAEQRLRAAQARGALAEAREQSLIRDRYLAEWQEIRRKREQLILRAPLAGVVTTPRLEQRVGEYLKEGDWLCTIADRSAMRARVLVLDSELEEIRPGAQARLNVRARPLESFSGRVQQILPAAALDRPVGALPGVKRHGRELYNYFAVTLEIPNPEGRLWEGMTGTAKIDGPRYPLAWRAGRSLWRWARSQVWF